MERDTADTLGIPSMLLWMEPGKDLSSLDRQPCMYLGVVSTLQPA